MCAFLFVSVYVCVCAFDAMRWERCKVGSIAVCEQAAFAMTCLCVCWRVCDVCCVQRKREEKELSAAELEQRAKREAARQRVAQRTAQSFGFL